MKCLKLERVSEKNNELFSCSIQLSMKFQLLIKTKITINKELSCFKSLRCCINHANKCLNAIDCWHNFNIYEHDEFYARLVEHEKTFITAEPRCEKNLHICQPLLLKLIDQYLHFQSKPLINRWNFAIVHSLMNDIRFD